MHFIKINRQLITTTHANPRGEITPYLAPSTTAYAAAVSAGHLVTMLPLLCLLPLVLALAQCSLVSVSGCQPDLTKVITTPPLPSDPRAQNHGDGVLSVVTTSY